MVKRTVPVSDDDDRLRDLVIGYGRDRWGTDNCHVAGSAFLIAYLTRLIWPVAAQYVLERRVPDVRLANLAFHWREHASTEQPWPPRVLLFWRGSPMPLTLMLWRWPTRLSFMPN